MSRLILTVVILLTGVNSALTQVASLANKTYAQRAAVLFNFYIRDLDPGGLDSVTAFKRIDSITAIARTAGDDALLTETAFMRIHYRYYRTEIYSKQSVLASLDSLKEVAISKNYLWLLARVEAMYAVLCYQQGFNYELAFIHFSKMDEVIAQLTSAEFPDKQICYNLVGFAYYQFGEWRNAIPYFLAALHENPPPRPFDLSLQVHNNLGLSYQQLGMYDSSDYHFEQTRRISLQDAPDSTSAWFGIATGNLGYNQFLQKNYTAAKPLLEKDVAMAEQFGDWGLAVGSLVPLAEIALTEGHLQEAEMLAAKAKRYCVEAKQYGRWAKLYPVLSKIASLQGKATLASIFLDSALLVKDSVARQFNGMQLARARQKTELEKHEAEMDALDAERKLKLLERNMLLVGICLLALVLFYVYRRQKQRVLAKQQELARAEKELEEATAQLELFTHNISEKNKLIETLLQQNHGLHDDTIVQLRQSTILTEDDWRNFQLLFEKVHGGFLERLRGKIPGLSPAETRFLVLSKLGLGAKEMTAMLGVGPEAIRQYRSRLRKKLQLTEETSLEELINSI